MQNKPAETLDFLPPCSCKSGQPLVAIKPGYAGPMITTQDEQTLFTVDPIITLPEPDQTWCANCWPWKQLLR